MLSPRCAPRVVARSTTPHRPLGSGHGLSRPAIARVLVMARAEAATTTPSPAASKATAAEPSSADWLGLRGAVTVVTGGSSGIGRACVQELLRCGALVCVADILPQSDGDKAVHTLAEEALGTSYGQPLAEGRARCIYTKCDVTSRDSVAACVARTEKELGPLHICIANAGINLPGLLVDPEGKHEIDEGAWFKGTAGELWDKIHAVNVKGVLWTAQAAARAMLKRKDGGATPVIICMTSESGLAGSTGQGAYAASKAAVYSMVRSWAKELGAAIRFVGVAPGVLEPTGLRSQEYEEALAYTRHEDVDALRATYQKGIPIGREAHTSEVANVVAFLASHRASYLTGVTVNVSGGKSWV